MEEISRASAAVGLSYGAHSNLCVNQLRRNGGEEQKRKYLPKLISGEHVGASRCRSRGPGRTSFRCVPGRRKRATVTSSMGRRCGSPTGRCGHHGDYAKTDRTAGARGITAFIVEKGSRICAAQKLDKLGCAVQIQVNWYLPTARCRGKRTWRRWQRRQRIDVRDSTRARGAGGRASGHHAGLHGVVIPYVHERQQFGQPIGRFQLVQAKLADMYVTMNAARSYVYMVASACDEGRPRVRMLLE